MFVGNNEIVNLFELMPGKRRCYKIPFYGSHEHRSEIVVFFVKEVDILKEHFVHNDEKVVKTVFFVSTNGFKNNVRCKQLSSSIRNANASIKVL